MYIRAIFAVVGFVSALGEEARSGFLPFCAPSKAMGGRDSNTDAERAYILEPRRPPLLARVGRGMNVPHARRLRSPVAAIMPRNRRRARANPIPKTPSGGKPLRVGLPPSPRTAAPSGDKRSISAPCSWGRYASIQSRRHRLPALPARHLSFFRHGICLFLPI